MSREIVALSCGHDISYSRAPGAKTEVSARGEDGGCRTPHSAPGTAHSAHRTKHSALALHARLKPVMLRSLANITIIATLTLAAGCGNDAAREEGQPPAMADSGITALQKTD